MEHHEQNNEQVFIRLPGSRYEVSKRGKLLERAPRMILDYQRQHESSWSAILSSSTKIGCTPQTLNELVKKSEIESGQRGGITSETAEKMNALKREVRKLKQANEILRKALPAAGRSTTARSNDD
jgi:transposase